MSEQLTRRYLWLIKLLKDATENKQRLGINDLQFAYENWARVHGIVPDTLSDRTLRNHIREIRDQYGVRITCRRGANLNYYYIENPEVLDTDSIVRWSLDSFASGETLLENRDISDKILLEEIPSGDRYLEMVLTALRQSRELQLEYESYFGDRFAGTVQPLCVKLFKRRWYMLAETSYGKRMYGLDRVKELKITDDKFPYPKNFDPAGYFANVFGVFTASGVKAERIVIRAYAELPGYLRSLPIHQSQMELDTENGHTDFFLYLVPTFDFVQELLLHRDQLEVIKPASLRGQMRDLIARMRQNYAD